MDMYNLIKKMRARRAKAELLAELQLYERDGRVCVSPSSEEDYLRNKSFYEGKAEAFAEVAELLYLESKQEIKEIGR